MMMDMNEESKRAEADRFNQNQTESLKKMQELQKMMMNSAGCASIEDGENEDEFDDYMEQSLLQEAEGLGILDKNAG